MKMIFFKLILRFLREKESGKSRYLKKEGFFEEKKLFPGKKELKKQNISLNYLY